MEELTEAFQHLDIRVNRIERLQNTIIEAANENFAMAADHINHLYLQVRNRVFGNPGAANEPEAFGRPSGALGKTGFLEFLNARMPNLDRQERNDVWRITGEIMNLTIDDMHNELDGMEDMTWRALDRGIKELMKQNAFITLQAEFPDLAAAIRECVGLWPLALCAQAKWTARSSYRRRLQRNPEP